MSIKYKKNKNEREINDGMNTDKKTPLYDKHISLGGKMVSFCGYLLPVQYSAGIMKEHMAVREAAGIFDVSHMGEIVIWGKSALDFLQKLMTNDFSKMKKNQVKYTLMCYEDGGVVDDLLVYKLSDDDDKIDRYMLVVNASNKEKDLEWILKHRIDGVDIADISEETALIALQGPNAANILREAAKPFGLQDINLPEKYYTFVNVNIGGADLTISRTGYTGEDGFEIYIANHYAAETFDRLMVAGKDYGITPCGLGARDTLRLEAGMPLYGHELSENIDPVTAGLKFFVKLEKECDFTGKEALKRLACENPRKKAGLYAVDKGILRENAKIFDESGIKVGFTTSGTLCPFINRTAAMAVVDAKLNDGDFVYVDIRGRKIKSQIVPLPFYKRGK